MSALYFGLIICYELGYYRLHLETDSKLLFQWFTKMSNHLWTLLIFWCKILSLTEYIDVHITHAYKENNAVMPKSMQKTWIENFMNLG